MQVVSDLQSFDKPDFSAVTIGTFDGVHLGHQIILEKVVKTAQDNGGKSILITFWPHPRFILRPDDSSLKLLSTFEEKMQLVQQIGVDYIVKLAFTPAFASLTADQFVRQVLVEGISTNKLFIGYDHRFGNNREGNIEFLKENQNKYSFSVSEIPRQDIDDIGVSSTKIRNALNEGDVSLAATLLGRSYSLKGKVVHGEKKGRSIGFPTANILVDEPFKLLPGDGVYAVRVIRGDKVLEGMLNIGFRPTLGGDKKSIEVHLFNFEGELYNEELTVQFVEFIRAEVKFDSITSLKTQLEKDSVKAKRILK